MRYISCLAFLMATNFVHAYGTVTAVTTDKGSMINVTIANGTTYRYSNCNNYTPYIYTWSVNDITNVVPNMANTAFTINDLTTAAVTLCIQRTLIP